MECSGKAMPQDFTLNLLDFTKSATFHMKFAGFHEICNERPIARIGKACVSLLLSVRTAMWSMPVVLTETENENDSANQNCKNDVAKTTLQK